MNNRREFLSGLAGLSVSPFLLSFQPSQRRRLPISCNAYTWLTFYRRDGKNWGKEPDSDAQEFVKSGIPALEPGLDSSEEARQAIDVLRTHNIKMPSVYVNTVLHKKDMAMKSIESVLSIAGEVKKYNTEIIVTNPSPIEWGGTVLKTDKELIEQAKNVEALGEGLRKAGLKLAYHTHDTELMAGAREFHHVLQNTTKENVGFCFDVHWVYRGSKDSQVAVFDILKMYGDRIIEVHLRQSVNGIWSETFGNGDIDYQRFADELEKRKIYPHLVIEQCIEEKTISSMNVVDAHKADLKNVQKIFKNLI